MRRGEEKEGGESLRKETIEKEEKGGRGGE